MKDYMNDRWEHHHHDENDDTSYDFDEQVAHYEPKPDGHSTSRSSRVDKNSVCGDEVFDEYASYVGYSADSTSGHRQAYQSADIIDADVIDVVTEDSSWVDENQRITPEEHMYRVQPLTLGGLILGEGVTGFVKLLVTATIWGFLLAFLATIIMTMTFPFVTPLGTVGLVITACAVLLPVLYQRYLHSLHQRLYWKKVHENGGLIHVSYGPGDPTLWCSVNPRSVTVKKHWVVAVLATAVLLALGMFLFCTDAQNNLDLVEQTFNNTPSLVPRAPEAPSAPAVPSAPPAPSAPSVQSEAPIGIAV